MGSIFVSSHDYMLMTNECKQLSFSICDHKYNMWCKRNKIDQVNKIIDKIKPFIAQIADENKILSFDKILIMAILEILADNEDSKITENNNNNNNDNDNDNDKNNINDNNEYEFDKKLSEEKKKLTDNFISILQHIKKAIEN